MTNQACHLFIFCLMILFCLPADSNGQNTTISLLAEAEQKLEQAISLGDEGNLAEATTLFEQVKTYYLRKGYYSDYLNAAIEEGTMHAWTGDRDQTILSFRENLTKVPESDSIQTAFGHYYHKFGVAMYILDDYNYARTTFLKAIEYRSKVYEFPNVDLARSYHNLGVMEKYMGQYGLGKAHLLTALDHRKALDNLGHTATTYTELGDIAEIQGDYQEAISYIRAALPLFEAAYGRTDEDVAGAYFSLGNIYESLGLGTESKKQFLEAQEIFQALGNKEREADCIAGLGIVEYNAQRIESAIGHYQDAIKRYKALDETPAYKLANVYNNLGLCYRQLDDLPAAFAAQNQALELRKSLYGDQKHHDLVASYDNHANLFSDLEDYDQAFFFFRKSLEQLIPGYDVKTNSILPDSEALIASTNKPYLLEVLNDLAKVQLKDQQSKAAALETYRYAANLMTAMRQEQYGEGSKLFWLDNSRPIFDQAIKLCYELFQESQDQQYVEQAWAFSEENKAVLLLESLQSTQQVQFANLSDSLISVYQGLRKTILDLEEQLNGDLSDQDYQKVKAEWIAADQTRNRFLEAHLGSTDPSGKTQNARELLSAVQAALPEDGMLIEYFDGVKALAIFRIDPERITMHYSQKSTTHNEELQGFLRSVFNKPDRLSEAYQQFEARASGLYQTLLAPIFIEDELPNQLLIAPDGLLSYLPFELLLTEKTENNGMDFLSLPYLLRRSTCHYTYSIQLWLENKEATSLLKAPKAVLGLASTYSSDPDFLPLPGASEEVVHLSEIYKDTNLKVGSDANRSIFMDLVAQDSWKTIHLAMHGVVDSLKDSKSRLAFTRTNEGDRNLYAYQIAGLDIQTPLVVLSACETGTGQLRRGEGVFSLARSFMSAGVPSVVMSLWSTNDQATKQIMGSFHQGLADGQSKAAALQAAKLAYLENPADPIGHPAYWAPFVLIGDEAPFQGSSNRKFLIAALVMVSFLFLFTMGMLMARISHLKAQKKASSPNGNEA